VRHGRQRARAALPPGRGNRLAGERACQPVRRVLRRGRREAVRAPPGGLQQAPPRGRASAPPRHGARAGGLPARPDAQGYGVPNPQGMALGGHDRGGPHSGRRPGARRGRSNGGLPQPAAYVHHEPRPWRRRAEGGASSRAALDDHADARQVHAPSPRGRVARARHAAGSLVAWTREGARDGNGQLRHPLRHSGRDG